MLHKIFLILSNTTLHGAVQQLLLDYWRHTVSRIEGALGLQLLVDVVAVLGDLHSSVKRGTRSRYGQTMESVAAPQMSQCETTKSAHRVQALQCKCKFLTVCNS